MASRTPSVRRCWTMSTTSPSQHGGEGTDSGEVWMLTATSVILFMSVSLLGTHFFFLIKETHFSAYSLLITSRCAIRGHCSLHSILLEASDEQLMQVRESSCVRKETLLE